MTPHPLTCHATHARGQPGAVGQCCWAAGYKRYFSRGLVDPTTFEGNGGELNKNNFACGYAAYDYGDYDYPGDGFYNSLVSAANNLKTMKMWRQSFLRA